MAIVGHGEAERSFRREPEIYFLPWEQYSSEKLRRAVASKGVQKRNPGHPAFLADGTDIDVNPADSDQLFLPGLLSAVLFYYGFACPKDLTTYGDGSVPVSVCQQAEVAYPHITMRQDVKKEPSDKFICLERHGLFTVIVCIISPEK